MINESQKKTTQAYRDGYDAIDWGKKDVGVSEVVLVPGEAEEGAGVGGEGEPCPRAVGEGDV